MLLAEVAGGRRDDRALGDNQLPARLNRHPHVFLTDEIERRLVGRRLLATLKGSPYIVGLKGSPYIVGLKGSPYIVGLKGSPYIVGLKGSPCIVGLKEWPHLGLS